MYRNSYRGGSGESKMIRKKTKKANDRNCHILVLS